jgi:hypothetical protein
MPLRLSATAAVHVAQAIRARKRLVPRFDLVFELPGNLLRHIDILAELTFDRYRVSFGEGPWSANRGS